MFELTDAKIAMLSLCAIGICALILHVDGAVVIACITGIAGVAGYDWVKPK